jgi:hypothetical protein
MDDEAALGVGVEQRCAGHEQKLHERHGMDYPAARWTGKLFAQLQQHGQGGGVGMQSQLCPWPAVPVDRTRRR